MAGHHNQFEGDNTGARSSESHAESSRNLFAEVQNRPTRGTEVNEGTLLKSSVTSQADLDAVKNQFATKFQISA
jgi:hypothetical protein